MTQPYLSGRNAALFTDLYELTMAQAYVAGKITADATFSLFYRELPDDRNYVLSCGLAALCVRGRADMPLRVDFIGLQLDVGPDWIIDCAVPPYEDELGIEITRRS